MLDVLNQQALAAGYVDLSTEFEVVCGTDRKRKQFVTDPVVACNIKALLMHNMEVRAMPHGPFFLCKPRTQAFSHCEWQEFKAIAVKFACMSV